MKIAFLLTQLEVGGAQVRVFQTASEMRRRGHAVDVIFLYQKRPCFEEEQKIILAPGKRPTPYQLVLSLKRLFQILRNGRYDAFISNTSPANILGNAIALSAGLRTRIAVQTQPPERLPKLLRALDKVVGTLGVYTTNIANSLWTRSRFDKHNLRYKRYLKIVHDGITPRTTPLSKGEAQAQLGLANRGIIIANVGRLSEQKDQQTLLRAMKEVDATLVIAGDGELRADLVQLAENLNVAKKVIFLGEIPGDHIGLLLRAADIFAFSSRWETFGLALVEAAASELPLVVTDLDVSREVLAKGNPEDICFVLPQDTEGFSRALNRVASDPVLRERMALASATCAREFSLEHHVDTLLALLRKTPIA